MQVQYSKISISTLYFDCRSHGSKSLAGIYLLTLYFDCSSSGATTIILNFWLNWFLDMVSDVQVIGSISA